MAVEVDFKKFDELCSRGVVGLGDLHTRFKPYYKEVDKDTLKNLRAYYESLHRKGIITSAEARLLSKSASDYTGSITGYLTNLPLVGGIFKWFYDLFSRIGFIDKRLDKSFI